MGLRSEPVDLERGEVRVEHIRVLLDGHRTATDDPKSTASRRTVPVEDIHPGTTALLRSLRARQAHETGLVLVNALGEPVRPELYSDRFRTLCRETGLRTIYLHFVRHTLAVELIRAGVTIVDAAALPGHTPDVFVSTYLRESESGVRSAASALGAALAGRS
jgi:integrase